MVTAPENFNAVNWVIIILVVKKYALFYNDFFGCITNINEAEQMVGNI